MLELLRHNSIVKLIEVFRRKNHLFLVFEYLEKSMLEVLEDQENQNGFSELRTKKFIYQLVKGLVFCHKHGVVHRDIKPENILVNPGTDTIKICDFGFCRFLHEGYEGPKLKGRNMTAYVATRWYRAPENLLGYSEYGAEMDMWAVGCLIAELNSGDPLFPGSNEIDMVQMIQKLLGPFSTEQIEAIGNNDRLKGIKLEQDEEEMTTVEDRFGGLLSKDAIKMMQGLLNLDPSRRFTAEQALQHSWFDEVRDNNDDKYLLELKVDKDQMILQKEGEGGAQTNSSKILNPN